MQYINFSPSFHEKPNRWAVEMSTWILYDGNYELFDFEVGQNVKFALEFNIREHSPCNEISRLQPIEGQPSVYSGVGEVIYQSKAACVLDFGCLIAYSTAPPSALRVGQRIKANLSLHVDPFMYYEELSLLADIPPIIFEWHIESLWLDATPFIETSSANGQKITTRDASRESYLPAKCMEVKPGGQSYILLCSKVERAPTKYLN